MLEKSSCEGSFPFPALSHEELVAQCVIFFLAGYDTTASTLSFTSYVLALHPEIQEKVIEELDDALKANNVSNRLFNFCH